ncbi:MAG: VWA domain-containing protein [Acidobacteriota bacterium]
MSKKIVRSIWLLLLLVFLQGIATAQQTTTPTRESEEKEIVLAFKTQLVLVPFSVADRTNRTVNNLKAEEVKLYENGQPVQLVSLQRAGSKPLNFALLLDLSGSMQPHLESARAAASRFFERALKPGKDRAAIVAFQQEIMLAQPLTMEKAALQQAIGDRLLTLPTFSTINARLETNTKRLIGTALYGAIYVAVDEVLQPAGGHRVIVLISDGYDSESGIELRDALDYAWRREVTIYAIGLGDPAGLNREVLERLCTTTGGRVFYPKTTAQLDEAFAQIDEDLREQYILSFYPNAQANDTFRTIKIEIPSRPSLAIYHRFGYYNALVDETTNDKTE